MLSQWIQDKHFQSILWKKRWKSTVILILNLAERLAQHKIGVFVAVLTFIGTIIGGGVVGLPKVFYFTGITFGIIMNVLCALGSIYAVNLLIKAKNITGLTSYSELGYACYG